MEIIWAQKIKNKKIFYPKYLGDLKKSIVFYFQIKKKKYTGLN